MSIESTSAKRQQLLPDNLEERLTGWAYRAAGAAIVLVCSFAWLTLLTWSAADPSLSHATGVEPRNWLGPLGAILADLLLQTFGLTAIFAFLAPMVWGMQLVLSEEVRGLKLKVMLFPLSILVLAGGLSSLPVLASWPLNHGFGGIVGDLVLGLATSILSVVNPQRAAIAAGMIFFTGGIAALFASLGISQKEVQLLVQRSPDRADKKVTGTKLRKTLSTVATDAGSLAANSGLANKLGLLLSRATGGEVSAASMPAAATPAEGPDPGFVPANTPDRSQGWGRGSHFQAGNRPAGASRDAVQGAPASKFQTRLDFGMTADDAALPGMKHSLSFAENTEKLSRDMAHRFAPEIMDRSETETRNPAEGSSSAASTGNTGDGSGHNDGGSFLQSLRSFSSGSVSYKRPSLNLLKRGNVARPGPEFTKTVLRGNARLLEDVLADFGIKGTVKDIKPGPSVTLFELEPAPGTKTSRVISLADDIARSMSVSSVRVAVIPGRNIIGIELPNQHRETVLLRDLLETDNYRNCEAILPLALGKSIAGDPVVTDLAQMPHLLVAGTTGSGKSVGVNAMILSLLYKLPPSQCRFIMIDPKMLELSVYNGIPHLLCPVVTDPRMAIDTLAWVVREMEERYKRMSQLGVRNINVFNNRVRNAKQRGDLLARTVHIGFDQQSGEALYEKEDLDLDPMPLIVIVVDEFADLMTTAGKEIEAHVQRLAQMARAAGIHMIMATQRPSVDIITGTIKANFPTRISFKVTSKIDSRTILGEQGAEQLLGHGDMLFSSGSAQITRVHGPFVSDEEVEQIAAHLRNQGPPDYIDGITMGEHSAAASDPKPPADDPPRNEADDLYDRAVAVILRDRKVCATHLQRRLTISYNLASELIARMVADCIISAADSSGKYEILHNNAPVATTAPMIRH